MGFGDKVSAEPINLETSVEASGLWLMAYGLWHMACGMWHVDCAAHVPPRAAAYGAPGRQRCFLGVGVMRAIELGAASARIYWARG